ncbi:MAG: lysylphosphatidylglycerol synthase transmembrane domain-containing protein [Casimicrobiaceae bacterium]
MAPMEHLPAGAAAPAAEQGGAPPGRLVRVVLLMTAAGAAFYLALGFWVGWTELAAAIARLGWWLAAGIPVSLVAYLVRFLRWDYLLRRVGAHVPWRVGSRIFLAGLALTATPAKAGENVRSVLLLPWEVPVGASLVVFFVERLTDLIAVLLLAALTAGAWHWWWMPGTALIVGTALRWLFAHGQAARLADALAAYPRLAWARALLADGMQGYLRAWRLPVVAGCIAIGTLAYGMQALLFALFVQLLSPTIGLLACINIFTVSTLAGAASMLPGGLGVNEITMIALLGREGMPQADAAAAAVGTRLVGFWLGIAIGAACVASFRWTRPPT